MNSFLFQGLILITYATGVGKHVSHVHLPCGRVIRGHAACMGFLRNYTGNPNLNISNMVLTPIQQEMIVGGLLGDLSIVRAKPSHNSRLAVRHSTDQTAYTMFLFSVFKNLCTANLVPKVGSYIDSRTGNTYYNISFFTRSLSCLNEYRELFYPEGVKIVPQCIGALLTELGLAI